MLIVVVVVVVDRLIWMGYGLIFLYFQGGLVVVVVVVVRVVVGYTSFNGKHMQQTSINFQRFRT